MLGCDGELVGVADGHGATTGAAGRALEVHPTVRMSAAEQTARRKLGTSGR